MTTDKLEMRRLMNMIQGEQETKDMFQYMSTHGVRGIVSIFVAADDKFLDELVS